MPVTPTPPLVIMIEDCQRRRLPPSPDEVYRMADFSQAGGIGRLCGALAWFGRFPLPAKLQLRIGYSQEEFADLVTHRFYEHVTEARSRGTPVNPEHLRQIILDCLP